MERRDLSLFCASSLHRHMLAFRMPLCKQRHCKEGEEERQRREEKTGQTIGLASTTSPHSIQSSQNPMSQISTQTHKPQTIYGHCTCSSRVLECWGGLRSKQGFAQSFACERYAVMLVAKVLGPYLSSHPLNFRASYSRSNRTFV